MYACVVKIKKNTTNKNSAHFLSFDMLKYDFVHNAVLPSSIAQGKNIKYVPTIKVLYN
jgi:hypothetical protein